MNMPRLICPGFIALLLAGHMPAAQGNLKKATWCRELNENQAPKDETASFNQEDTVHLSIELEGRPKSGVAVARFLFRGGLVAEGKVDVAEVNKGVLFSVGQNTFVGFTLKTKEPMPVGDGHSVEVSFKGKPLGTFAFKVAPPQDAIPSKLNSAKVEKTIVREGMFLQAIGDITQLSTVILVGEGDLGLATWVEVEWLINGKKDPAGSRTLTLKENMKDCSFHFTYLPRGGWPVGDHEAALIMNGAEVSRQKFNVKPEAGMATGKFAVAKTALHRDDGNNKAGEEVEGFTSSDRVLHVTFTLPKPTLVRGADVIWSVVKVEGDDPGREISVKMVEVAGEQSSITSYLRLKNGAPPGEFRVELRLGAEVLAGKTFSVKKE